MNLSSCPFCNGGEELKPQTEKITLTYKGEDHLVDYEFYKCDVCNTEFTTTEQDTRTLNQIPGFIKP